MSQHEVKTIDLSNLHDMVGHYFEDDGRACADCDYLYTWQESRGEFWGAPCSETLHGCKLLEQRDEKKLRDCPGIDELLSTARTLTEDDDK